MIAAVQVNHASAWLTFFLLLFAVGPDRSIPARRIYSATSSFPTYNGLIMAGYQGWFNAPDDGAGMGWGHYAKNGRFGPGACKIDQWPDVTGYAKKYATPFRFADGSPAYVFSDYDSQTVALHFSWMREYGIDGAFLQRQVTALKDPSNLRHHDRVLSNALAASQQFHRAIAIMYDFSGLNEDNKDYEVVINDWRHLVDSFRLACRGDSQTYLYHHGKPLVGIWGVGFPDRHNDLRATGKIIDFLQHDPVYGGCSVLLGVPAYWRDLGQDTEKDPYLHELLRKVDIVRPWFVGRFDEESYPRFRHRIAEDVAWCKTNKIDYVPVVFPGFSWHNMHPDSRATPVPRNGGRFYWQQLAGAIGEGVDMIYVTMFDEMDEGTAIFKTIQVPPGPPGTFVGLEIGIPPDHYLRLTGIAAKMLRREAPLRAGMPLP